MSKKVIANRYAKALLKLDAGDHAKSQKNLAVMSVIGELFKLKESADVLKSPVMPSELKMDLLNYAQEKSNDKESLAGFVEVVLNAGRIALFPEIILAYKKLINEAAGLIDAKIITSVSLPESEAAKIIAELEKTSGRKIIATYEVDSSILGGFIVKMGNTLLDLSLKTKLDALTKSATL